MGRLEFDVQTVPGVIAVVAGSLTIWAVSGAQFAIPFFFGGLAGSLRYRSR